MNITLLTGSPHRSGSTALLADRFIEGARNAGHAVTRHDIAGLRVHPCTGCDHCRENEGECVFRDDMAAVLPHLLDAELVVLVTPLYYFGMSAQLKAAVDRFYSANAELRARPRPLLLLAACGDTEEWAMDALKCHYEAIGRYLGWECLPPLLAFGCHTRGDTEASDYPELARKLGESLR